MEWLVGELWVLLLLVGFAIGANESVTGLATLVGSGTLPARVALLTGAATTAVAVLLLASPEVGTDLLPLFPDVIHGGVGTGSGAVPAALAAVIVVMVTASLLGQPVPAAIVLVSAVAGAVFATLGGIGSEPQAFATATLENGAWAQAALWVGLAALALPVVAGLVAVIAGLVLRARLLSASRPRDRLRGLAPVLAGITVLTGLWLCLVGYTTMPLESLWLEAGLSVVLALVVAATMARGLARRPFEVANDVSGAEAGFGRLQVAGSLLLCAAQGGYQALLVSVPAALIVAGIDLGDGSGDGGLATLAGGTWLAVIGPLALGLFAGVFLLGHRTARRVGRTLAGLSASRGAAANLATIIGLTGAGVAGLPLLGGQAAVGAAAGVGLATGTLRWGALALIVLGWLVAPPLAAALAYGLVAAGV